MVGGPAEGAKPEELVPDTHTHTGCFSGPISETRGLFLARAPQALPAPQGRSLRGGRLFEAHGNGPS
jgi:hypothetical protein